MKKLILLLGFLLVSSPCVMAQGEKTVGIKKLFNKPAESMQSSEDEGMTSSQQAAFYYNDNDVKKAFDFLLNLPEAKRTDQDWLLLGNMLQDQNKNSDAIFMYQRAILINPKCYKAYYNLGNIYLADEKPFMAIQNYRNANKINPKFAYAYYNLGCAYLQAGNLKSAKIAFLKAIELKNTEPDFHYNLAYTYKKLNKEKLSKQYLGFYNKLMDDRGEQSN